MATVYRRDEWVQDHMGNGVSGVFVYLCEQPATTDVYPPTPLAPIYSDSAGQNPLTNPQQTDAYGHCSYHAATGTYTVVYWSPQIAGLQVVLPDQVITAPPYSWNNDSSTNGTIVGVIDGVNTVFTLSGAPTPIASLVLTVNGIIQTGWTISGAVVNLAVAPHGGNTIEARYVIVPAI
jgi:hypothetical protein